ncbi:MAG: YnbE family lipoprotein [Novosphingobium sp.]|nr:YnbE family lipoprotein [Novosphingobium sp.]
MGIGSLFGHRALLALPLMGALLLIGATTGCISVNAPDKPIVIELNINIKQEVVYRLAQDANATIESNPDIF